MENKKNKTGQELAKQFEVNRKTFAFFVLSCLSCHFYLWYWCVQLVKKINIELQKEIISPTYIFIAASFYLMYLAIPTGNVELYALVFGAEVAIIIAIIGMLCGLIPWGLSIFISIKMKNGMDELFLNNNIHINTSMIWAVIFPIFYQYYLLSCVKNREIISSTKIDSVSQLEKLAELKDKGILTEQEFEEKKKSILEASN